MAQHWLVRPTTIRWLWRIFIAVLAATVAAGLFVHEHLAGIAGTFGFAAWFGFLACAALILAAKAIGALLKRPDTYYDEPDG